jgi:membrane-bound lytic murein transglycosylase D
MVLENTDMVLVFPTGRLSCGSRNQRTMGMGRHLFRRAALALSLLLASIPGFALQNALPMPPRMSVGSRVAMDRIPYKIPRQNHAAPKAWSIDVDTAIGDRSETAYWIEQWSSPEGLEKLRVSSSRLFPYRSSVSEIVRSSAIPWEVMAIPIVESNWRIDAVSSSGAAGPWQFLAASGRGRDLIIDAWRDERRDIWRSTEAAMEELAFYDRLFSDWLLAAASYNAGPTRMRKLWLEHGGGDFWDLLDAGLIPSETRSYVPQVIAVAYITSHAGRFGLPLEWAPPIDWIRIDIDRSISINELSEITGGEFQRIKQAHSELNHPFSPPPGLPYSIKVPREMAEQVRGWLTTLETSETPERFWRYTIRSGDTLSGLADRYGIPLGELVGYNGHVADGFLRIGGKNLFTRQRPGSAGCRQ